MSTVGHLKFMVVLIQTRLTKILIQEHFGSVDGLLGGGWLAGPVILVPLRGSILQAETCQILSLAENPRWSPSVAIMMHPLSIMGVSSEKMLILLI